MKPIIFRRRILSVGALAASFAYASAGFAQEDASEDEAAEEVLETVIVTGTRLERSSFDTTQPSTSFDAGFPTVRLTETMSHVTT